METFDLGVGSAFWLMNASTLLCVVYGVINWNKDKEEKVLNTKSWDKDEARINKDL
ncbi:MULTISPECIES: symporter small accessory protein [unclassified Sulfurospirillum]|uniref:symporter small accessory protein n=1 Tax=unclassified Sulfurospirillum TaxID=2618290 RepID=UPI000AB7BAA8|nr:MULTISPECIES: symporter small accessory protein [unclassified Sulfurospirillum]